MSRESPRVRGIFRVLSESEETGVDKVKTLDLVMGTNVEMDYCYSLHITVPSVLEHTVMDDPQFNVYITTSAKELPTVFSVGNEKHTFVY